MIRSNSFAVSAATGIFIIAASAGAQALPPVRPLGPALSTSTEPMAAVSQVRALPGGRVIVNDNTGRRVLLFDSTLTKFTVIADTTSATAHAYGPALNGLIAYRADSSLLVDPVQLSMFLIDGSGKIVRTMAAPQASEVNFLVGGPFGTPGLDPQGRLVYKARVGGFGKIMQGPQPGKPPPPDIPDSGMVVRFDLATRAIDTVAKFLIPTLIIHMAIDENGWRTTTSILNPIPWTDDWALLADGTVAVIRGQEYRVDLFDATGRLISATKIPFDWQRLNDDAKAAIIDSARTAYELANAPQAAIDAANAKSDSSRLGMRAVVTAEATVARAPGTGGGRAMFSSRVVQFITISEALRLPPAVPPSRGTRRRRRKSLDPHEHHGERRPGVRRDQSQRCADRSHSSSARTSDRRLRCRRRRVHGCPRRNGCKTRTRARQTYIGALTFCPSRATDANSPMAPVVSRVSTTRNNRFCRP